MLWPRDLTPLVVELRAVCPALVAASDAGLARVDCNCSGAGWACGDYPECATAALERRTHARCLRTTHAAATACWVRLDHARVPALAARRNYDEAPTHAYTGGGGLRAEAAATVGAARLEAAKRAYALAHATSGDAAAWRVGMDVPRSASSRRSA
mgnify:CR=1 FL=1